MKNEKINKSSKKKSRKSTSKTIYLNKINSYQKIIQDTILYVQKYKNMDILDAGELNICVQNLENIYEKTINISKLLKNKKKLIDFNDIVNRLQVVNDELSTNIRLYGTKDIDTLLNICLGSNYILDTVTDDNKYLYNTINSYVHPISYKILDWKEKNATKKNEKIKQKLAKNRIIEDFMLVETAISMDCFDLARTTKNFQTKVYGIKVCFQNPKKRKTLIISGVTDDMVINCIQSPYLQNKLNSIIQNKPQDIEFLSQDFERFCLSLTLKDLLVYNRKELYQRYMGYINQTNLIKKKTISQIVKEFISSDLYGQRKTLIQLLMKNNNSEFQYLAYLLYDLLSNDTNGNFDTVEQTILFDSLPWNIKKFFREAMKTTISYTKNLSNFDINKIPIEQQICLLKAKDSVKEKAMLKLKEVKAKSEDSGSKARQYLDGLLKIPFGIFKKEKILTLMSIIQDDFKGLIETLKNIDTNINIPSKKNYSSVEIIQSIDYLKNNYMTDSKNKSIEILNTQYITGKRDCLIAKICFINSIVKKHNLKHLKILHSGKKIAYMKSHITDFFNNILDYPSLLDEFSKRHPSIFKINKCVDVSKAIKGIDDKWENINTSMKDVKNVLENSIYGHNKAKRQIERVIGQWITGKQSGYCFGFEGPPGVGKCHRKGTPIMLSNGKIKKVENVKIGDKLMGDDSTSRNVLALGSGREKMYEIKPVKGDSYVVNESHILSLKMTKAGKKGDKHQTINGIRYFKNDIVDICINDYLKLPKYLKECLKGYKVPVKFPEKKVDLDPYVLGYWLGDGTSSKPEITTVEEQVVEYFKMYADDIGLEFKKVGNTNITYRLTYGQKNRPGISGSGGKNPMLNMLRKHNVLNNKHIPYIYKCNCKDVLLELLAGIIDSDGSLHHGGYDIIQKNERLLDDIIYVARSLGFAAYKTKCEKSCFYKGEKKTGTYYRTFIHGENIEYIPVKVQRKKTNKRKQIKNVLNTGIKVIPLEEDEYYGFQIDGNSRFLLGDFTVTHNTSLARKGLANCLKDEDGTTRPFSFIALGGSSNGSTLSGHNYTYVGSTWGRIVDILMEQKCMNPIIFIDELDKVSKTENGKEIIGILTHLIDPTQNDTYQDKYFSGIDIDMSKALFVFSYNDVGAIDKILLDRIHRVKFDNLTLFDKLEITNKYILPELYEKVGLNDTIIFKQEVLKFIIENYTYESGVRKLKEILFEIISEINLEILNSEVKHTFPYNVTKKDIKFNYLKDKNEIIHKIIHKEAGIGVMNGLWANNMGMGGIIPIECYFLPSNNFMDLKLTGLQGDVMKESMNVAKTLAWKLTDKKSQTKLCKLFEKTKLQGIHIHCPEGAVPKDGPSAGTAITIAIYSLLNKKKIKNNVAITGEINLQGKVSAIGGLELKILGGLKAGIKTFIYPTENQKDYLKFVEKYNNKNIISDDITFINVSDIKTVLNNVFV